MSKNDNRESLASRVDELLRSIASNSRASIARAITILESNSNVGQELAQALKARAGNSHVIGITGAPGAGKSSLISAMLGELLERGKRIAVVAVDPSSPITGGAVLGDRVRMGQFGAHENVFIRSIASRGHLGGLSKTTGHVINLFDAVGFDVIIVETVGAGQSEVEISQFADTSIVVCPPGLGDDVQASKAGILEIADILVVNKSDLPLAERTVRELQEMLTLRKQTGPWTVPVIRTVATARGGIADLTDAFQKHSEAVGKGTRMVSPKSAEASKPAIQKDDKTELALMSFFMRDQYVTHTGIQCISLNGGLAKLKMKVAEHHINFNQRCHGGAIFTLADTAFGLSCNSYGTIAAGIDVHMTYQQPVSVGETLLATAFEVSRSKKLCVYRVEIRREEDGMLISSFTGTAFFTGRPHVD